MQESDCQLLSVKEVAGLFGKHPNTIKNWIRAGHLQATRAGRRGKYLISKRIVHEFINNSGAHSQKATK